MLNMAHDKHWPGGLPVWDLRDGPFEKRVAASGWEPIVKVMVTPEFMDKATSHVPDALTENLEYTIELIGSVLDSIGRNMREGGMDQIEKDGDPIPVLSGLEINDTAMPFVTLLTGDMPAPGITLMTVEQGIEGDVVTEDMLDDVVNMLREAIERQRDEEE